MLIAPSTVHILPMVTIMSSDWQDYTDRTAEDRTLRRVIRETWRKGARAARRAVRARKAAFLLSALAGDRF